MFRNRNRSRAKAPREPEEPDTTAAIGFAKKDFASTKVYLVKMPNYLMEKFAAPVPAGQPAPIIGRLRIPTEASLSYNPNVFVENPDDPLGEKRPPPRLPLSERARIFVDGGPPGARPDSFELHFLPKDPRTFVFSESAASPAASASIEGTVAKSATARPSMSSRYRQINRARTRKAEKKTNRMIIMDEKDRRAADNGALKPSALIETHRQREERKRMKEMNRKHLDVPDAQWRELAKVAIFKAFEGGAHYAAEQIAKDIDEPLGRLRGVLNEVCVYNKSGAFAGKYELKDEFKTKEQRMQKERELEEYRRNQIENAKRKQEERVERERPNKRSKN